MRLVCISDTHNLHNYMKEPIPDGDVLICGGDITNVGKVDDVESFNRWIAKFPHKYKIVIAGNHDWLFMRNGKRARSFLPDCIYLENEEVTIEGIKFYGSPYTPVFFNWAFMLPGKELEKEWAKIPNDTDVLITHGPPFGRLDMNLEGQHCGCERLLNRILDIKPKVHIFGHIHEAYGIVANDYTTFINASICTRSYAPSQKPIVWDLNK